MYDVEAKASFNDAKRALSSHVIKALPVRITTYVCRYSDTLNDCGSNRISEMDQ